MFAQQNRHVAYEGDICYDTANNVFPLQVILSSCVELRVVCYIIVSFRQEFCFLPISPLAYFQDCIPIQFPFCQFQTPSFNLPSPQNPQQKESDLPNTKLPHNPMHNRDILPLNIIHHNLADLRLLKEIPIP
jgi:hypothetical protein